MTKLMKTFMWARQRAALERAKARGQGVVSSPARPVSVETTTEAPKVEETTSKVGRKKL